MDMRDYGEVIFRILSHASKASIFFVLRLGLTTMQLCRFIANFESAIRKVPTYIQYWIFTVSRYENMQEMRGSDDFCVLCLPRTQ